MFVPRAGPFEGTTLVRNWCARALCAGLSRHVGNLFAASSAAMRALLPAVSSSATIWSAAAIGTPMIAPINPKSAPNARTLVRTVKPETWAALPMIVGCRMLKRAADDEQDDRRKQGGNRNSAENTHSQCHSWQADDGYRCAMTTRSNVAIFAPGRG